MESGRGLREEIQRGREEIQRDRGAERRYRETEGQEKETTRVTFKPLRVSSHFEMWKERRERGPG